MGHIQGNTLPPQAMPTEHYQGDILRPKLTLLYSGLGMVEEKHAVYDTADKGKSSCRIQAQQVAHKPCTARVHSKHAQQKS